MTKKASGVPIPKTHLQTAGIYMAHILFSKQGGSTGASD